MKGDVVKASSEIDSGVSKHEIPFLPLGISEFSPKEIARILRIEFTDDGFVFRSQDPLDINVQSMQVSMRPLSLENGALKWIHALYYPYEGQSYVGAEDPNRARNPRANRGRRVQGAGQGGGASHAAQALNSQTPPIPRFVSDQKPSMVLVCTSPSTSHQMVTQVVGKATVYLPLGDAVDLASERQRLQKELASAQGRLTRIRELLSQLGG